MLLNTESETVSVDRITGTVRAGRLQLYHQHLPHLSQAGHITWDREAGAIDPGPSFDEVGSTCGNPTCQYDWAAA